MAGGGEVRTEVGGAGSPFAQERSEGKGVGANESGVEGVGMRPSEGQWHAGAWLVGGLVLGVDEDKKQRERRNAMRRAGERPLVLALLRVAQRWLARSRVAVEGGDDQIRDGFFRLRHCTSKVLLIPVHRLGKGGCSVWRCVVGRECSDACRAPVVRRTLPASRSAGAGRPSRKQLTIDIPAQSNRALTGNQLNAKPPRCLVSPLPPQVR